MHQARRGWRGPRRGDGHRRLLAIALAVVLALVVVVTLVLLAQRASSRPATWSADARAAALTSAGPGSGDYPWAANGGPSGEIDPRGFLRGSCASYVAWWLNTHGVPFARDTVGPRGSATFTDAGGWDGAASRAGFVVSARPRVGSIAQWHAGEQSLTGPQDVVLVTGHRGHVAVVQHVFADGSVLVVGMDGDTHRLQRARTRAPRYLDIGTAAGSGVAR